MTDTISQFWADLSTRLPMYHLSVICLLNALIAQTGAAFSAIDFLFSEAQKKPYRLPWMALSLGQILMILECWRPFKIALRIGLYDFYQSFIFLMVSIMMFVGVTGMAAWLKTPKNGPGG